MAADRVRQRAVACVTRSLLLCLPVLLSCPMAPTSLQTKRLPRPPLVAPDARLPEAPPALDGVDETVWVEVIRKMDEVYNDLLQYEVVLEQKNAALEESQQFIESVLASMSDILIVCNRHGAIQEVNDSLRRFIGLDETVLRGRPLCDDRSAISSPTRRHGSACATSFRPRARRTCRIASC